MDAVLFTRAVLLGASGAGKSRLLDEIAAASGVAIVAEGDGRWIDVTTSRGRYAVIDAPADRVDAQLTHDTGVAILVVAGLDGPLPATRRHVERARMAGIAHLLVYVNDAGVEDVELLDLVELEIRELATKYEYPGDTLAIVRGRGNPAAHVSGGVGALAAALDALPIRAY